MNPLYVGIDVSSKNNVIYLMLPNGDKHSSFSLANSHDGSTQLVKRIFTAMTGSNFCLWRQSSILSKRRYNPRILR